MKERDNALKFLYNQKKKKQVNFMWENNESGKKIYMRDAELCTKNKENL